MRSPNCVTICCRKREGRREEERMKVLATANACKMSRHHYISPFVYFFHNFPIFPFASKFAFFLFEFEETEVVSPSSFSTLRSLLFFSFLLSLLLLLEVQLVDGCPQFLKQRPFDCCLATSVIFRFYSYTNTYFFFFFFRNLVHRVKGLKYFMME